MRLQQTINEQNLSKPERLGNSVPPCSGQRVCYGEEYEPMYDASVECGANQIGIGLVGCRLWRHLVKSWSWLMILRPGRPLWAAASGNDLRAPEARVHTGYSRLLRQTMEWVWNLGTSVRLPQLLGMIKTADERRTEGRSLRSSLSAGKPHTWRRKAVDTVLQQEVGLCPAW